MAAVVVKHHPSGGPADPLALVDGPTYDADPHIVTGLENVDNTSDVNKPVSTAQAAADALRVLKAGDTMTGTLTMTPTAASTTQAINITQTSPTSGSATGPLSYNLINVNDQVSVTTVGTEASSSLPNQMVSGFRTNMTTGGTNMQGQPTNAGAFVIQNTVVGPSTSGDLIGVLGAAYSNISHNTAGLYGMNALVRVGASGVENQIVGIESDVIILTGGSSANRFAFNATAGGNIPATSTLDVAYLASSATGTGQFKHLVALSNLYGFAPIVTTGDLFFSDTAFTVAHVFNMSNVTVTGNIFDFGTPFKVTGAGALTAAGPILAGASSTSLIGVGTAFVGHSGTDRNITFGSNFNPSKWHFIELGQ